LKTKIGNLKNFFIPYYKDTYSIIIAYIFVDFRIKRAGSFNSRGAAFWPPGKNGQIRNTESFMEGAEPSSLLSKSKFRDGWKSPWFFCCFCIAGCATAAPSGKSH
jgi:hypothetical protein